MLWRAYTILIAFGYFQASIYGADKVADWNSSTGNWSDASKWTITPGPVDPGTIPNNGNGGFTYDANINSGSATLDLNVGVGHLYLARPFSAGAQLTISGGHTLTTSAGGSLGNANEFFGSSSTGTVNVTGFGSTWINTASRISVGVYGTGNLNVTNGGVVTTAALQAGDGATFPFNQQGSGDVKIVGQGSSLSVNGLLNIGFNLGFGHLTVDNMASVTASELKVGGSRGSLKFNLGPTPGASAPLNSNGPATISNSTLYASFAAPPSIGEYPLLHYQQLIGQFGPANVDGIGQMGYLIDYGAGTNDTIKIKIILPGDHNSDGSVDAADYIVWRKTDGTQASYNTWRANFGRTFSGSGSTDVSSIQTAVPEPAGFGQLVFLASVCAVFRLFLRRKDVHRGCLMA